MSWSERDGNSFKNLVIQGTPIQPELQKALFRCFENRLSEAEITKWCGLPRNVLIALYQHWGILKVEQILQYAQEVSTLTLYIFNNVSYMEKIKGSHSLDFMVKKHIEERFAGEENLIAKREAALRTLLSWEKTGRMPKIYKK